MQAPRRTHPLVMVAAATVSLFSLVGIGAVMGWIPTTVGQSSPSAAVAPIPEKPAQPQPPKLEHRSQPKPVARSEPRRETQVAAVVPPPPPPPAPVAVAAVCHECAVIEDIRTVEKQGQASGVGAVGGAVVGGILGHQVGAGRGKDLATVLGALGGGLGGNQIEKSVKTEKQYQTVVRYDDGRTGTFTQATPPAWRKGDKVKVIDGAIKANG
ncbi:MAG TPA: glycine zipper 2TM domain-containing protein [Burkholderiales bacterium]|nr:glycine zipper 2TM domain-containing protein [Burkholderiales bacterium]